MAPWMNRSRARRPRNSLTSHHMHTIDSYLFGVVLRELIIPVVRVIIHWLTGRRLLYIAAGLVEGLLVAQFVVPHLFDDQSLAVGGARTRRLVVTWGIGSLLIVLCLQVFGMWALSHRSALADLFSGSSRSPRSSPWSSG